MKILSGHTSPETAFVVDDYPYGYTLRCKIRYWLEWKPSRGFRLMWQTTNPKRGNVWNKPKASTYARFGAALYLEDNGHLQWSSLTEYCTGAEAQAWFEKYGEGVPEIARAGTRKWVAAKLAYDANREDGDHLAVGLPAARKAWTETE